MGRGQNGALLWYDQDFKKAYNDRLNISFQRQLPGQIVLNASFFMNFGHQLYNQSLNVIDPQIQLKYQNSLNQTVANPFYHYLTPTLMPGPLYNQQTVSLGSLLVPYPQYSGLAEFGHCCARRAVQLPGIENTEGVQQRLQLPVLLRVHSREGPDLLQRSGHLHESPHVAGQRPAEPPLQHGQRLRISDRQRPEIHGQHSEGCGLCDRRLEAHGRDVGDHRRPSALREPDRKRRPLFRRPDPATLVQHGVPSRRPRRTHTCCAPIRCSTAA